MNREELDEIIHKHKLWLNDEEGGERADLRGADLCCADLSYAGLVGAKMHQKDMELASLSQEQRDSIIIISLINPSTH